MKINDSIPKEDLPDKGRFNDWMVMINGIERINNLQVDMPYYKFIDIPKEAPIENEVKSIKQTSVEKEKVKQLNRTIDKVKSRFVEWVLEWNRYNQEDESLKQWEILNEKYINLNKAISIVKKFYLKHIELINDCFPILMPKKPSNVFVTNKIIVTEVSDRPPPGIIVTKNIPPVTPVPGSAILNVSEPGSSFNMPENSSNSDPFKIKETRPDLSFQSVLFPSQSINVPTSSPHSPPPPPPPPSPPPPPQASQYASYYSSNQINQMNLINQLNQINQLNHMNQINQNNWQSHPAMNLFTNPDVYTTLLKLRGYGLMDPGSFAEKVLNLIEQSKK
jgi:hypothetical protein